ncbi:DNA polymerase I [Acaricomes phytoseiuli]|uniref:DNA polymerase I n=1 Tax=Acaricomes phytoseiuli TaxID=291968 RepID=UPI00039BFCEF|nr:DNA polymerase I [Acaricomes phytoseiuli]MCW1249091.1 DNA polymerase I [Acaricomes phytoseiuli]
MSEPRKLLLIDGHSMAFRAFYALPPETFITDTGQHTNAVYGFTSMLLTMIRQQKPSHVVVAFDLDGGTFRTEEYSEYKAGRARTPEEFHGQVDLIGKVLEAMNIPAVTLEGYEADDIIATASARAEAEGWQTLIVSGDRDAFQLITDSTLVLYPKKGISDIPPMDRAAVEEKYLVPPELYPDLAALVGESADNLPGVPGVGPKTAAKWIKQYEGLEGILANADSIGGKVGDSLRAHLDSVKRNRRLNHLVRDLQLPISSEQMELQNPDRAQIEELFDALQFNTLRKRLFEVFGDTEAEAGPGEHDLPEHRVLQEAEELSTWFEAAGQQQVAFALSGAALPLTDPIGLDVQGVALSTEAEVAFIPVEGLDAEAERVLAEWFSGPAPKAVHDLKAAYKALSGRGLALAGVVDDTSISAYLIQPERRHYELADLSQIHLKTPFAQAQAQAADQLDLDLEGDRGAQDAVLRAYVTGRLSAHFESMLAERKAQRLLSELELPLAVVLAKMELAGIAVSREVLDELMADFTQVIEAAQRDAFAAIGHEVNLGSPKQLQVVLFEELGMPKTKKIKTGYSTDADALADLLVKTEHPFLVHLQAYRDATKLRQTVEGLIKFVADDGRVHTTYAQNIAATGRLSSNNPNLQNIPIRSEAGRQIRNAFVVGEEPSGKPFETLLTADYSQIEMRIMAHLSGDEGLIQAFRDGEDLHRFVGSHIFQVEPEDVTSAMRSKVKAMSYGLVYGLSSFGLSKQLKISVDEARTLMKDYFERFGAVRDYLRGIVEQARIDGYTATIEGRRRYLPELTSDNRQLREMAERAALNAPIQGSAADIIKRAMIGVDRELRAADAESRMLLQVHDELVLEIAPGELEEVTEIVRREMSGAAELSVPLDVQTGVGSSWFEAGH